MADGGKRKGRGREQRQGRSDGRPRLPLERSDGGVGDLSGCPLSRDLRPCFASFRLAGPGQTSNKRSLFSVPLTGAMPLHKGGVCRESAAEPIE